MAKKDLLQLDGEVIDVCGGGIYKVKIQDKDLEVATKLCGKMRRFNIQVVIGDKVTVGFSPHDLTNGLIIYRYR